LQNIEQNIEQKIKNSLDKIRIYLQEDGGDVEFAGFNESTNILYVRLTGNCSSCPFSIMTLRAGIERFVKFEIEEVSRVEQVK